MKVRALMIHPLMVCWAMAAPVPVRGRNISIQSVAGAAGSSADKSAENQIVPKAQTIPFPNADALTVGGIIDAYLADLRLRKQLGTLSGKSLERAEHYLGSFGAVYGQKPHNTATPDDLTKWLLANPQWVSPYTRGDAVGVVITCFRWAWEEARLVDRQVYRKPRSMRFKREPDRPMTRLEYAKVMRQAMASVGRRGRLRRGHKPLRRALFFMRRTGCRTGEMLMACWEQIDWQAAVLVLPRHKTVYLTGEPRLVGLEPCVYRFLANIFRRRYDQTGPIFLGPRGKPWCGSLDAEDWPNGEGFWRAFRHHAKSAGFDLDVAPYGLRHEFATEGIINGVGERQIADQLGQRSTRWVSWYARQTLRNREHLRGVATEALRRKR